MEKEKSKSPFFWVLSQAGVHKSQFALSVILALIGVAASIAPYFVVVQVVRGLMGGNQDFSYYLRLALLTALFWFVRVLCHALSTAISHKATFITLGEIRKKCMEKLSRMPLGDVLSAGSGALKNTLIERIDSIETTLAHIVPEFTANLIIPIAILIYIFTIDVRMGFASILTLPIGMFCFVFMMVSSDKFYGKTVEATKNLNDTAVEYISGIQVIKVFGKTKKSYEKFSSDAYAASNSFIDWMRASNIPFTFAMVIMPATLVGVLPIGGLLVKNGSLTPEDFVTIIILALGVISPIITLMSYSDDIRTMSTIVGEVRGILDAREMERPEGKKAPAGNDIALRNVHFSYEDKEILHGIDMDIKEGSFVALVGPSGSGKSTIARLIASLWDVDQGKITLGGSDIREISTFDYADRIAFVSQDNYLFNMTVRENIRLGRPDATDEEVELAAKRSGCHDFIMGLEHGYDTKVGSSGGHLSGGERQRISIARAMLKNARIVILDEATAYTDPENEAIIQRSVSELTKGKTLITIAHRLSTIVDADNIFVIKDGTVAESGRHDELLQAHGLYEKMWKAHMEVKDND